MFAHQTDLLKLLQGLKQFVIPIYQRRYKWEIKECRQLLLDIREAGNDEDIKAYFIGSVVYIQQGVIAPGGLIQPWLVIDGQQRMTTISLLIACLADAIEKTQVVVSDGVTAKKLKNYYLLNSEEDGDRRYKLLLTIADRDTFKRIVDGVEPLKDAEGRVLRNAEFFSQELAKLDGAGLSAVYHGITKLVVVDVALDHQSDNPQLIFTSLNSTGLKLTQADLIRNYVLMELEPKQQEKLYAEHWEPMERGFETAGQADALIFDRFIRDYLTVKMGKIPKISEVYAAFKEHAQTRSRDGIVSLVADIHKFAEYYLRIAQGAERDVELHHALNDIRSLKVDVAYPFLLEVFELHDAGDISRDDVLKVIRIVESYVFRRAICEIATNTLNKTFPALAKGIEKSNFVTALSVSLSQKQSRTRFPTDGEFHAGLLKRNVYEFRNRDYLLSKLENHDRREHVQIVDYTIEHILPQNPNLSSEWRASLGEHWKDIQTKYLHTLGNLTLTRYNSTLSDKPFKEKRDMKGGFRDSPVRLNHSLRDLDEWNETAIENRANLLAAVATKLWPFPTVPVPDTSI